MGWSEKMIQLFKGDLTQLSPKKQKKICKCPTTCESFINIVADEDFILCEVDAREHAFHILRELELLSDIYTKPTPFWSYKDEQYIIDYFDLHGPHNGAYKVIGAHLGRSRDAVKNRVLQMRKEGKL
jgi:hypothetical protein